MPALKFWRQTKLNFLSAISITYSNTLQHCQLFQPFTQKKKKKREKEQRKKDKPLHNMAPVSTSHGCRKLRETHIPLVRREKTQDLHDSQCFANTAASQKSLRWKTEVCMATAKKQNTSHHHKDWTPSDMVD